MTDLLSRIERARWWAIQNQPFYGTLAMRLTDEISTALPTAATDGRKILWGESYCGKLCDEELRFILLHEALHCAHQHIWRLPLSLLGNMAGDYAINAILKPVPGVKMPQGGLYDPKFDGLAEEEILQRLKTQSRSAGGGYTDACGGWMQPDSGQGDMPAQGDPSASVRGDGALQDSWRGTVIQATFAAKAARGNVPADMERLIADATARRIDWRAETAEFIRRAVSARNDWSRQSRRGAGRTYLMPRRHHDTMARVVIVRDTSGSVDESQLAIFNAIAESCLADCGCDASIIDCDAAVNAEYDIKPGERMPRTAKGGGGTSFIPALIRAAEVAEKEAVAGVIYLTDMDGTFPADCDLPVLWIAVGNRDAAPFGRVVKLGD